MLSILKYLTEKYDKFSFLQASWVVGISMNAENSSLRFLTWSSILCLLAGFCGSGPRYLLSMDHIYDPLEKIPLLCTVHGTKSKILI